MSALTKGEGRCGPARGDVDEVEVTGQSAVLADAGRHRLHRSPARGHAMKVLYGDDEWALIVQASQMLGLRPSSYVASAVCLRRSSPSTRRRRTGPAVVLRPRSLRRIASCWWS